MKLPLNWLKDYIDLKLSTESLVERLTMAGLEVEAVEPVGADTVLEIEITPNRPDCLSILGLAREVGAITGKAVKTPKIKKDRTPCLKGLIHVENKKDCSRYIGTVIREARITDAPQAMKQRLASLGINAINNAVDITNFVLMETGQPLHAFDYDKLAGGKVIVRRARAGEALVTLDGVERKLDPSVLVIADEKKPVAIAGIMGGMDTQITPATKNILLEAAHFDMGLVRRASRSLGLRSDSSYRFERNVDFEGVARGCFRATELLLSLTSGKLAGRAEISSKPPKVSPKIKVKISDIESLLGAKIPAPKIKTWLSRLGFKVTAKAGNLTAIPPVDRMDVRHDVDVIEEIARMIGFDRLPSQLPRINTVNIPVDKRAQQVKDHIRRSLTAAGLNEIITLSMINSKALAKCHITDMPGIKISNPLSQDQELMRPVLLPSFLQVVLTNFNRGQKSLRFFEIGKTYSQGRERETLGLLLTGRRNTDWRLSKKETVEIFDLKGLLERIFQTTAVVYEETGLSTFDPACAAFIKFKGDIAGIAGRVSRQVLANWDIKNQDVYFAAVYLDHLLDLPAKTMKYQPISEFPAIVRDVSLGVDKSIPYQRIEEICRKEGGGILKSVQFIEQYTGDKIQPGLKGLVFSCQYQSNARTLREEEVSAVHERILQTLSRDLGVVRR